MFFDEADSLFGRRTNVKDAHNKYANQEVSYLLQCVENYNGLVILATNFKSNIDEAFVRRFQSMIHFPRPDVIEWFAFWKRSFPKSMSPAADLSIENIAKSYELSGGEIMNIVHYACLQTLDLEDSTISRTTLLKEYIVSMKKRGKISDNFRFERIFFFNQH